MQNHKRPAWKLLSCLLTLKCLPLQWHAGINADFHTRSLCLQIWSSCEETFEWCKWNGEDFDCCKHFLHLETELGICYSVNNVQTTWVCVLVALSDCKHSASVTLLFLQRPSSLSCLHPCSSITIPNKHKSTHMLLNNHFIDTIHLRHSKLQPSQDYRQELGLIYSSIEIFYYQLMHIMLKNTELLKHSKITLQHVSVYIETIFRELQSVLG